MHEQRRSPPICPKSRHKLTQNLALVKVSMVSTALYFYAPVGISDTNQPIPIVKRPKIMFIYTAKSSHLKENNISSVTKHFIRNTSQVLILQLL